MPRGSKPPDVKPRAKQTKTGNNPAPPKTVSQASKASTNISQSPSKKQPVLTKKAAAKTTARKAPAKHAPAKRKAVDKKTPATRAPAARKVAGKKASAPGRSRAKDEGLEKFWQEQHKALMAERQSYEAQAEGLKAEADQMAQDAEPGDIQFDEESGEGGTVNIDRERHLALSAQARAEVAEIDHALDKIATGAYGICEGCGQPIPRARLKALPQARLCVACKSGGLSRR